MAKRASHRMSIDARHFVHSLAGKETLAPSPSRNLLSSLTEVLGQTSTSTTVEGSAAPAGSTGAPAVDAGTGAADGQQSERPEGSDEASKLRSKTLGTRSTSGHRRSNRRGGGASFTSLHTASYVPNCVILRHARQLHEQSDNGVDSNFSSSPLRFTLVIIDVSGFTKISGWLQQHKGVEGPELMSGFLSRYFHRILDCVAFFGGDVLKFAGDALICMWPELPASVRQACVCAATVVQLLHNYSLPGDVPHTLSLHAAVHLGAGTEMYLGGVRNRWEHCISGALYRRAGHVLDSAPKGSVLASSAVFSVLAKYDMQSPDPGLRLIPFGVSAEDGQSIVSSSTGVHSAAGGRHTERMYEVKLFRSALKTVQPFKRPKRKDVVLRFQALQRDLPMPFTHPALEAVLRRYCPPNLKDVAASVFAAEMRDVTTVFILLPDYSPGCAPLYQQVIVTFQVLLSQFDGRLRQFLTDDKGTVMIGCFGLPGTKAMGRAVRAVRAAVLFRTKLSALCELQMGISSGLVYCGNIGDASRCEYCMLGDSVNMAARMMGLAKKAAATLKKQQMKDQSQQHLLRRRHQRGGSHASQQLEVHHEVDDPQSSCSSSAVASPSQHLAHDPQAQEPAVVKASLAAAAAAVQPGGENGFAARSFIFCDEATYNAVRDEFVFDDGQDVLLKGKSVPMKCYAVRDDIGTAKANRTAGLHGLSQEQIRDDVSTVGGWGSSGGLHRRELPLIVGRDPQLDRAWSNISSQVRGSPVSTVVAFSGPKGSGKTTVLHRLIEMARLANFTVVKAVPAGSGHIDTAITAAATFSATNPESGDTTRQYGLGLNSFMYTTVRSWLRGLLESNDWLCVDVWMRAKPRERGQLLRLLHQQATGVQPIPTIFLNTLYETGILEGYTEVEMNNLNASSNSEVAHEMDALAGQGTEHTSAAQNSAAPGVLMPISNAVTTKVSARHVDVQFEFTPVVGGATGLSNPDAAMPTDAVNSVLVTFFKYLFCAVGAGRVILAIDDVEFADAESLTFLGQMLATDDDEVQPTVLLTMGGVSAARTERRASSLGLHNGPMLETPTSGGLMLSSSDGQGLRSQHEIQNVLRSATVSVELPLKRLRQKDCFILTRQLVASYARALVGSRSITVPSPVVSTNKRPNDTASRFEDVPCTPAAAASAVVDDGVAEFVFARSAGSPLYVHELIKFLLGARDQRIELVRNVDNTLSWKLIGGCAAGDSMKRFGSETSQEPNLSSAVPSALRDILIARVEDCSYAARTTLKMASVIGKRFSRDELLHLALVTNHISVTEKSAAAARARRSVALVLELDELVAAQILVVDNTAVLASAAPSSTSLLRGTHRAQSRRHSSRSSHRSRAGSDDHSSRGSPRTRKWLGSAGTTDIHKFYSFIHSSMHEVVYSMLLSGHRRRLHRYFAECLRVRGAELPRIADQFERSDQTVRAMSTYMELSAAASSLGNIERAIEVLERAVMIVDGIIMSNNDSGSRSDASSLQTGNAANTVDATRRSSVAENQQNAAHAKLAEPSRVARIPPKFQQIYLKLLTMMMRYKVFLLNKHADLGASGVGADVAQRSMAPLRQMHLSMVRFMRTFPHLAGENLMACLNASVMMHLVDPLSHVDMLTWRNRLSRLTSDMLIAARKQDEPYHVVMALDWVRMNARISQATAAEEQYAAECEQLYCNELPQPTTAKKLDATYGVDNGLLCILCARTRLLLQGNMPRAAELSHHVSAATHFSTNVMSLIMASINEMIWCAILNTGHGSLHSGRRGAELVANENLRLRRKLARLGVDLSQQTMPIQFLLPLFSPWIWIVPVDVEDRQMEADLNPNHDLQAEQVDLPEQNAGEGASVFGADSMHEANLASSASPLGETKVETSLSLGLDLETVSQWCENCEQEAAWQKAFPPRAVVTRTIYDGFLGNAALLFKMGCLTVIRRCKEFLDTAGVSANSTNITVQEQIVEAKAVYTRVCRGIDSVWDITDNNGVQPPLLPIIQSLTMAMRVSLGIARGFNLRIVLSDIQSATAFARLHHLDFARLLLARTIATEFAAYAAQKVSTTSNNTEDLGYCFIGDEELARTCAQEVVDACQVVLELAPQFVQALPQFETESLRRGKEWANLVEASTTKGSEDDDSQASDAVDRDFASPKDDDDDGNNDDDDDYDIGDGDGDNDGDNDGDGDDEYLAGIGLAAEMDFDEGLLDDEYDGNEGEHDNVSHSVSGHSSASYSDEEIHSVSGVSDDSSSDDDLVECTAEVEDRVMAEVRTYITSIDLEQFEKLCKVAQLEATAGDKALQTEHVDQVQSAQAGPGISETHHEVEHADEFPPIPTDDEDDQVGHEMLV